MNSTYKGKNLQVLLNSKSIALATSHSLDISISTVDITTKDDNGMFTNSAAQSVSWTMSSDNLVSYGTDGASTVDVIDMALVGTKVTLIFGLVTPLDASVPTGGFTKNSTADDAFAYTGDAIITSVSVSAANGERATYSISFQGCGELKKVSNS